MRIGASLLAALSGVSAWVSLGTQAVTNDASLTSIAALPPLWILLLLTLIPAAVAWMARLSLAGMWPLALSGLLLLPYLPMAVPAAFLMWQGPGEALVWCLVVAGLIWASPVPWPRMSRLAADPRQAPWLAGATMAVVAVAGFIAVRGIVPNGDEPHYLVVTQSLLLDGDLQIENNHARGDYLAYFSGRLRPDFLQRGQNGEIYSIHSPGISAVVLPAFAVAGYAGAVATVIAMVALGAAVTWHVAWLLSASVGGAWLGWAAVFLTTPFFFHEFAIYPDAPAALLVMLPIWLLVSLERGQDVPQSRVWAAGAALAALPWFHSRFALIAASLGLILLARLAPGPAAMRRLVALFTVPALAAAAWFGYFWVIWGTVSPSAPYGEQTNSAFANVGRGAIGLLIDQQFGLVATAPIYALAAAGLVVMARRHRRFVVELLLVLVPYLLTASSYAMWWGGNSAPARFLVALMPIAALPIAWWWSRHCRRLSWRQLTWLGLLVSMAAVVPRAWVDGGRLLYNSRSGFDLALEWASRTVDLPLAFPSVHRSAAAGAAGDGLVWLAVGVLMAVVAHGLRRLPRLGAGATWTVITCVAAVLAMVGGTAVWGMHGVEPVTVDRSALGALAAYSPRQATVVQLSPFRPLAAEEFVGQLEFGTTDRQLPAANDPVRLRAALVPAGEYRVLTDGGRAPLGEVSVVVGRNDPPIERWRMDGHPAGDTGVVLHLPVAVASVTLRGQGTDRATLPNLRLRPVTVRPPANPEGRRAVRATRYGPARVFFFDEQAYLEPTGFWTRAGGTATVVVDLDEAARADGARLFLRAGAVATTISAAAGGWTQAWTLRAGQDALAVLPPQLAGSAIALTLRSGPGFRPFAVDAANDDVRSLAVWVEIR